jgi:predicted ATPase/class 3 adenylate cyclase
MAEALTLLFTDIEGSTRILDQLGERYADLISEHHRVMREAIAASGGREVDIAGDSFFSVFSQAADAIECARHAQLALAEGDWPGGEAPRVRMGIHTGAPEVRDGHFVGMDVHRAARVMAVAHGGQVLLTDAALWALEPPARVSDLGYHRLKDLPAPEHLFQLLAPGLESEFPQLRSLNRTNLPTPANPLVGRREESQRALQLLSHRDVRLLTLVGAGGAGKTRLAIELAGEAVTRYREGVWLALLAPIGDRALMVSEVARVLGVDPVAGQPLETTLGATLAERELLLVLDNFERLVPAAVVVAELLAAAPNVDVLATSREPLGISGEHLMEVPPLPPGDAGELFLQRAMAARPGLTVNDQDRAAIGRICARLDGLPLALELAAARSAVFGPRALEARLAERLALSAGPRDLPARQRTLRATIDWSYQLLEADQRHLLETLAPFIGGIRIDSAESLWGPDGTEALISLAAKSLLRRREDPDDEPRFWMLETVREFALEEANAHGTADGAAERHAEHFSALAEQAAPHLTSGDQGKWLDRLESELPNLRTALDHLMAHDQAGALRMAANLFWLWDVRGRAAEGLGRMLQALATTEGDDRDRARALMGAGALSRETGDVAAAVPLLAKSASLAQTAGDVRTAVYALSNLAWAHQTLGDNAQSVAVSEQAINLARSADDEWALALTLNNQGDQFGLQGDFQRARALFEESLALRRRGGEPRAIALTASNLAQITLGENELETTEALVAEGLIHARRINYQPIIIALLGVGALAALHRGEPSMARAMLADAVPSMAPGVDPETAAIILAAAAPLAAISGETLRAATLWAAAEKTLTELNRAENPTSAALRDRWLPRARAAAPDAASWDSAYAHGAEISLDEALAAAVSEYHSTQSALAEDRS